MQFTRKTTVIAFFIFVICLPGCDLKEAVHTTEKIAKAPETRVLTINNLRPGQEIAGILLIDLNYLTLDYDIEQMEVYLDEQLIRSIGASGPYRVLLDTPQYPEGEHFLRILLWEEHPDLGLLNLLDQPSLELTRFLTFNQAPPTPVSLTEIVWLGTIPQISWEQSPDANFRSYTLKRVDWDGSTFTLLTTFDPSATSYLDVSLEQMIGDSIATYHLTVSNGAEEVHAAPLALNYGNRLPGQADLPPAINPQREEIYLLSPDSFQVLSTITNTLIGSVNIRNGLPGTSLCPLEMQVGPQQQFLYFLARDLGEPPERRFLVQFDPGAFTSLNTIELPEGVSAFQVSASEGVLVVDNTGGLQRLNPGDGSRLDSLPDLFDHPQVKMRLGAPQNVLYLAEQPASPPDSISLKAVSLGGPAMQVEHEAVLPLIMEMKNLELSADGQSLYLTYRRSGRRLTTIEQWDAASFTLQSFIPVPIRAGGNDIKTTLVSENAFFITYSLFVVGGNSTGVLVKLDLNDPTNVLGEWNFLTCPRYLVTPNDQQRLYAFGFSLIFGHSNWLVEF